MKKSKWNELEIALLVLLAVCLLTGAMSLRNQDVLQQKMIRLHVVANSDSDRDQTLKLQVRDKVLAFTEQTMRASASREEANNALREALPQGSSAHAEGRRIVPGEVLHGTIRPKSGDRPLCPGRGCS